MPLYKPGNAVDPSKPPEIDSTQITSKLRTDTLAVSVTILLAMTVAQRTVGFVRSILICRWLPQEEVGQWDMAFGFLMLASPLAVLAIPACFGRYLEYYRQQGQLKSLITRTGIASIGSTLLAALIILNFREQFSFLIFGGPDKADIVGLLALVLVISVTIHYFIELLNAMRLIRILGVLQFMNSFTFAIFCIVLVLNWKTSAVSIIVAYGISCLIGTIGIIWRLAPSWKDLHVPQQPPTQREFWKKISPYILWITLTSLTSNLFAIADRFMIIHYSKIFTEEQALEQVGVYFSSRIIPMLIVSVAIMLGNVILPHLSNDWEQGQRDRVRMRLNLFLKLLAPFLTLGGLVVLAASPLIFDWAFRGKYNEGLEVLPMTLAYCIWTGLFHVGEGYLLCAEKAKLGSLAFLIGLIVNICLNLVLLPKYGLAGAVMATTMANALVLVIVVGFNRIFGFRIDRFTLLMLAAPALLFAFQEMGGFHYLISMGILLGTIGIAWVSGRLFSDEERTVLTETAGRFLARLKR